MTSLSCTVMLEHTPFKCSRCGRSYDRESVLRRHGYYCRTKNPTRRAHRKRSCLSCARAKTRCNSALPSCSTCTEKEFPCEYDEDTQRELEDKDRGSRQSDDPISRLDHKEDLDLELHNTNLGRFVADDDLENLFLRFSPDAKPSTPASVTGILDYLPAQPVSLTSAVELPVPGKTVDVLPLQFHETAVNFAILQPKTSLTFAFRRPLSLAAQTSAKLLRNIMMSFPGMMQRRETLPPFIHRRMISGAEECSQKRPDDVLIQCMSLARTWSLRSSETASFVWRTVRSEIETWWSDNHSYSNNHLLACQQALLIYTLMRMSEGTRIPNPIDEPLLLTLVIVSKTLVERVGNAEFIYGMLHQVHSWDEWIFHESRRRIAALARLINLLVDIDSAVNCYLLPGYVLVPLPAGRLMWEAASEAAWKKEFDLSMSHKRVYGLGGDGKLKTLQQRNDGGMNEIEVSWEEYLAHENGFGMMVMIAGSIIEANRYTSDPHHSRTQVDVHEQCPATSLDISLEQRIEQDYWSLRGSNMDSLELGLMSGDKY